MAHQQIHFHSTAREKVLHRAALPDCAVSRRAWCHASKASLSLMCLTLLGGLLIPRPAMAVPAFARKYETSCQTCHVVYPKLTPFGEAFRRNGFRFPERDEDMVKKEPVPLGQDVQRELWPTKAVWPGEIPSENALSTILATSAAVRPDGDPETTLGGMSAGINMATTLGKRFSAWAGLEIEAETRSAGGEETLIELERVFTILSAFEHPYLEFRIGQFEPQILGFTVHRNLGPAPWISTTAVKDNQFTVDPAHRGIEATGVVVHGRLGYSAGLVQSTQNVPTAPKDVYGRMFYKLGGMRLDGVGGGAQAEPWRETSVQIGAFGLLGQDRIGDPAVAVQDDRFFLAGGDINFSWRDLNLVAAYARGQNNRPSLAEPLEKADVRHVYSQVDYVVLPWLVPSLRYEHRSVGDLPVENRFVPIVSVLVRANIRTQLQASIERKDGAGTRLTQLFASLGFVF